MNSTMRCARRTSQRGFALFIALGVLALLAVIGTTYVTVSGVERDTASSYVAKTRAMMLALSGMEYGITMVRSPHAFEPWSEYHGEDWNGLGEPIGTPDGDMDDAQGNRNGVLEIQGCPLEFARRPSFFADENRDGFPDLVPVSEGGSVRLRGFSGRLPGTYHRDGDHFVLRVEPTAARVSINEAGAGYRKLYDNLGDLVLAGRVANLGARIQAAQPYQTVDELVSRGVLTAAQLDLMRPYLTVFAWRNPTTMRPDPQTEVFSRPEQLRRADYVEARAPIDINSADTVVIQACLTGISGYNTDRIVPRKRSYVLTARLAEDLAQGIVQARAETFTDVNSNRRWDAGEAFVDLDGNGRYDGPFRSWQQFESWILTARGFTGHGRGASARRSWSADLVLANANPNTDLNCLGPEHQMRRAIDKADLIEYTTEFCFESNGMFTLRSLGRVTDSAFRVIGMVEIEAVLRLYETAYLSTQEDFENAMDRTATGGYVQTLPEEVAGITNESYADNNHNGRFDTGDTFTDLNGDGMRDGPAIYDGQIALRSADPPVAPPWGDDPSQLAFRALFNDSPTAGRIGPDQYPGLAGDIATPTADRGLPLAGGGVATTVRAGGSLLADLTGANDYPDLSPNGLLVREEFSQMIYWNSIQNWPVGSGSISFWVKPIWESHPTANQYKDILTLNQQYQLSPNRGRLMQLSAVHFGGNPGLFNLDAWWYTRSHDTAATEVTSDAGFNPNAYDHTSYQLNLDWDFTADQWHHFSLSYTDQIRWRAWMNAEPFRAQSESKTSRTGAASMSNPSPTYNHMTLGSNGPWAAKIGSGTYDDFCIWRSQVPATDTGLSPAWRYTETGPSQGTDYVGRVSLPNGARLHSIGWTEMRPTHNYRGEDLSSTGAVGPRRRPDVHFSYRMVGESIWHDAPAPTAPDDWDGFAWTADSNLPAAGSGGLEFRFRFDRAGQDPFRNTPVVDDLTVNYTGGGGVVILSWRILQE